MPPVCMPQQPWWSHFPMGSNHLGRRKQSQHIIMLTQASTCGIGVISLSLLNHQQLHRSDPLGRVGLGKTPGKQLSPRTSRIHRMISTCQTCTPQGPKFLEHPSRILVIESLPGSKRSKPQFICRGNFWGGITKIIIQCMEKTMS